MGYNAVLIDIGEVISIPCTSYTYKLDGYSESIPPRAILCFVEKVKNFIHLNENNYEIKTFLSNLRSMALLAIV